MQLDSEHSKYRSWWRPDDLMFPYAKNSIAFTNKYLMMIMIHEKAWLKLTYSSYGPEKQSLSSLGRNKICQQMVFGPTLLWYSVKQVFGGYLLTLANSGSDVMFT